MTADQVTLLTIMLRGILLGRSAMRLSAPTVGPTTMRVANLSAPVSTVSLGFGRGLLRTSLKMNPPGVCDNTWAQKPNRRHQNTLHVRVKKHRNVLFAYNHTTRRDVRRKMVPIFTGYYMVARRLDRSGGPGSAMGQTPLTPGSRPIVRDPYSGCTPRQRMMKAALKFAALGGVGSLHREGLSPTPSDFLRFYRYHRGS